MGRRLGALQAGWTQTSVLHMLVHRSLWLVALVIGVILITFALMHAAPGNPWDLSTQSQGAGGMPGVQSASGTAVRALNAKYGLDHPWWNQLLTYVADAAHFDFGSSYQYTGRSASDVLLDGWQQSAVLGFIVFIGVLIFGTAMGAIAALRHDRLADRAILGFATVAASVPNFVMGILLVALFSVGLYKATGGRLYLPDGGFAVDAHLVLPAITLGLLPAAFITRLSRASALEVLREDYVNVARAKGLSDRRVLASHVLRNSLIPIVTALGPLFGFLIVGSVVVESLFQIQGIGAAFVNAISVRDYPVIMAGAVLYAVLFLAVNLVVDVLYLCIDPRIGHRLRPIPR